MSAAVESARSDIPLDLEEAVELGKLVDRSNSWCDRVAQIAPKRSKRHGKGSRSKFTIDDLISLIGL